MPKLPASRPRRHFKNIVEHRPRPVPAGSAIVSARDTTMKSAATKLIPTWECGRKQSPRKSLLESAVAGGGIGSAYSSGFLRPTLIRRRLCLAGFDFPAGGTICGFFDNRHYGMAFAKRVCRHPRFYAGKILRECLLIWQVK